MFACSSPKPEYSYALRKFLQSTDISPIKENDASQTKIREERSWAFLDDSEQTDLYATLEARTTGHTLNFQPDDKPINQDLSVSSNYDGMSFYSQPSTPGWRGKDQGTNDTSDTSELSVDTKEHVTDKQKAKKDLTSFF